MPEKQEISSVSLVLITCIVVIIGGYLLNYSFGASSKLTENDTDDACVINNTYDAIYWKHVPLPPEAKILLNDTLCYHSDCFEVRENNTLCYIEIGKYFGTGINSTCYLGDGNLVVVDCSHGVCSPSQRTKFDLDVTEKVNIFYYNNDLDECCVVSRIEADRATEYHCFDSTLYDCVTRVISPDNTTTEGGE